MISKPIPSVGSPSPSETIAILSPRHHHRHSRLLAVRPFFVSCSMSEVAFAFDQLNQLNCGIIMWGYQRQTAYDVTY